MHAGDAEIVGTLSPRLIAVHVAAAFRRRLLHYNVSGYQRRVHGVKPDEREPT